MPTRRNLTIVCILICTTSIQPTRADEKSIEFEGYSPAAERAIMQLVDAVRHLKTYSDDAVFKMETNMPFFPENEQSVAFAYAAPKRFKITSQQHEVYSDGKELTVFAKAMRRYTVEPLKKDVARQVKKYFGSMGMTFGIAELVLEDDPRKPIAKNFIDLDVAAHEAIEGDRCTRLDGLMKGSRFGPFGGGDSEIPVSLWLRDSDHLIRRIEIDMAESMKEQAEEDEGMQFFAMIEELKMVLDVRDLKVNKKIDKDAFAFKPRSGVKKVDRFYGSAVEQPETALQFEMSGKQAPDFELQTADGRWLTADTLRGNVVVMQFLHAGMPGTTGSVRPLHEVLQDYNDQAVEFLCVYPSTDADKLVANLRDDDIDLTVLLDPDRTLMDQYFDEQWSSGIVLISKEGIVQGKYNRIRDDETKQSLRTDIDKLLKGETLSGGEKMTQEQITEAEAQRGARFYGNVAESLNEDDLPEAWSVHASRRGGAVYFGGGGAPIGDDMWLRTKTGVIRVTHDGRIAEEIPLPKSSVDQFGQEQFVVGRVGSRTGVILMTTVPGEEQQQGWRPPKAALFTAYDGSGREIWEIEVKAENHQPPRQMAMGNLDGRRGDELVFVHQSAIWIVDARGEVVVRKPLAGRAQWLRVEDRDGDRRDEIYIHTAAKLHRFDYRPNR